MVLLRIIAVKLFINYSCFEFITHRMTQQDASSEKEIQYQTNKHEFYVKPKVKKKMEALASKVRKKRLKFLSIFPK